MKKINVIVFIVMLLFAAAILTAQESETPTESEDIEALAFTPGFIFNTSNLLLDLESYNGGIGAKLLYPDFALRLMANAGFQTSTTDRIDLSVGFIFEKPFFRKQVTPYAGISAEIDFANDSLMTDDDNWTNTMSLVGKIGGILGAEVFVTDFLSFFAEYELAGNIAWTMISQSTDGTVGDPSNTVNYNITTGIGNSGSIGVVIYLEPVGIISPTDEGAASEVQ